MPTCPRQVTAANAAAFVEAYAKHKLEDSVAEQAAAFRRGLLDGGEVIPIPPPVYFTSNSPYKTNMGGGGVAWKRCHRPWLDAACSTCCSTRGCSASSARTSSRLAQGDAVILHCCWLSLPVIPYGFTQ